MANFQPPSALNECPAKSSVSDNADTMLCGPPHSVMDSIKAVQARMETTRYPMGMPRPVPRTMLGANDIVRRAQQSARRAHESARRAQESARRAQESALRVQESARRAQESALCSQLNALSAKDITP